MKNLDRFNGREYAAEIADDVAGFLIGPVGLMVQSEPAVVEREVDRGRVDCTFHTT